MFNTPILFLIFNRPVETQVVFDRIKEIKPSKLYVAADGAREGNYSDIINLELCKNIINQIDWNCELVTLYRDKNLGCGKAVSQAITWFFKQVEQGIILEDDCAPNNSFFVYCEELLSKYQNDENVYHIGGCNFQEGIKRGEASYYFSSVAHVWGWATWRRAWEKYDLDISDYPKFVSEKKINHYFEKETVKKYWLSKFESVYKKEVDTWDYQWTYTIYKNKGLAIIPNENLVNNIGFGENATHTYHVGKYDMMLTKEIDLPLIHTKTKSIFKEADNYFLFVFDNHIVTTSKTSLFLKRVRKKLSLLVQKLIINYYYNSKNKNSNSELIVKTDSIGDYIIIRSLLNYYISHPKNKHKTFYLFAHKKIKDFITEADRALYKDIIYFDEDIFIGFNSTKPIYDIFKRNQINKVINAVFSRDYNIDNVVSHIGAHEVIGHNGDISNQNEKDKKVSDTFYTKLIDVSNEENNNKTKHEFYKNKYFFETILNEKINIEAPFYNVLSVPVNSSKIVIFPSAQSSFRRWSSKQYANLISKLSETNKELQFYVCLPEFEKKVFNQIQNLTSVKLKLIDGLKIDELLIFLSDANCIIGSDSAPAHIAASINKHYFCLCNGNHYNRFIPYPKEMNIPMDIILPNKLKNAISTNINIENYFFKESKIDLKILTVEEVFDNINLFLKSK